MRRDAVTLKRRLDDLLRRCREAGVAATPQRIAVYRALLESEEHPSPEALFRSVRAAMPSLSLATIYKALDALRALGVVREVAMPGDSRRYDANIERHHHLACTRCKRIMDYYDAALDAVEPPARVRGFIPHAISVQVLGLCESCSGAAPRARPGGSRRSPRRPGARAARRGAADDPTDRPASR